MYDDLSPRAQTYLQGLKRNKEYTCSREELVDYFRKQNFPLYEPWIDFQVRFSGYKLTVPSAVPDISKKAETKPEMRGSFMSWLLSAKNSHEIDEKSISDWFEFELISKKDIENSESLGEWESTWDDWFPCGRHGKAQYNFAINDKGEIAAYNPPGNYELHPFISSPAKYVEDFALRNELFFMIQHSRLYENPPYHWLGNPEGLSKILLDNRFSIIEECSDQYKKWFKNDSFFLCQGTWLDHADFFVHIYSQTEESCIKFLEILNNKGVLKDGWPGRDELLSK